jgi:hypothetical protein
METPSGRERDNLFARLEGCDDESVILAAGKIIGDNEIAEMKRDMRDNGGTPTTNDVLRLLNNEQLKTLCRRLRV